MSGAHTRTLALRTLALQVALATVVLCMVNAVVAYLGRNSVPRQLLRRLAAPAPATDVFYGNSLIAAGVDEAVFDHAMSGAAALNAGLGATKAVEHYVLMLSRSGPAARRVYYGYLDDQLTERPRASLADLIGNRAVVFFAHPDTAALYLAPSDPAWRLEFRFASRVPMYVHRGTIWGKTELVRRRLSEYGSAAKRTNRFGRVEDFSLLESEPVAFARAIDSTTRRGCPLAPALTSAFRHTADRGERLVVVKMPMPTLHRTTFYASPSWSAYDRCVQARALSSGASAYIDASAWVPDSEFVDRLHLSPAGARRFTAALAARVVDGRLR